MDSRLTRVVVLGMVAVAAATVIVPAAGSLAQAQTLEAAIWPLTAIVASLATVVSLYVAIFRSRSVFRGFRVVLAAALGSLVLFLFLNGAVGIRAALLDPNYRAASLTWPLAQIILGVFVAAGYYFSVVAQNAVRRILENIFSIPELLRKLGFTLVLLCIYRIGYHIPVAGLNQDLITASMQQQKQGAFGQALEYLAMFTGGSLQQGTLFGLGIMPYISASIILQLLVTVMPALERLQKEGQAGYRKIQEYGRYLTIPLALMQAIFWMRMMQGQGWMYPYHPTLTLIMGVAGLTAGTMFLMWLGEQIDEYGIGNGISLIIMAGIVARMPLAVRDLLVRARLKVTGTEGGEIGLIKIIFLVAMFVFVVAGAILICQAQRRIPIQQAKHTRGRRVYGGQRQYLPLRVNHGGVMPIIFASSLLVFPSSLAGWINGAWHNDFTMLLARLFARDNVIQVLLYVGMIFFFAYFWTTVQFRPKDMAENLQDYGSFIPGLRPGRRTADYLEKVMERITYCGAAFLAVIAVIPQVLANSMGIPWSISTFLGGTGLLITVSVGLDLVQRIESNLIMRNYGGFLGDSGRIKGAYS